MFVLLMVASMSMILVSACGPNDQTEPPVADKKAAPANTSNQVEPALVAPAAETASASLEDRLANGKNVYAKVCAACHQADGQGLKGAFPPLAASDTLAKEGGMFAVNNVLNGLSGPITVNGVEYNSVMPPAAYLSDTDIADVVTYVLNSWDNPGGEISATQVAAARNVK